MIRFACRNFSVDEIVKCGLGLSKADISVLKKMSDREYHTSLMLAKKLSLNISTVQRAVKKLHAESILERKQENLDEGGYVFHYRLKSNAEIRSAITSIIDSWADGVKKELETWKV